MDRILEIGGFAAGYCGRLFAQSGYDVVVLDSATHFYKGSGGLLEIVDALGKSKYRGNTYAAWNDGSKIHNRMLDAITQSPIHVIVTARTKMKYVEGDRKGQMVKVGMDVEQRDGFEYEFDIFTQMTIDHVMTVEKTRCSELDQAIITKPDGGVVETLRGWLTGARVLDGVLVDDEMLGYSDNAVKFLRSMRKDLGRNGTEEVTAQAHDILAQYVNGDSEQVAKNITGGRDWDTATLKNLNTFLEKAEATVRERLQELASAL